MRSKISGTQPLLEISLNFTNRLESERAQQLRLRKIK